MSYKKTTQQEIARRLRQREESKRYPTRKPTASGFQPPRLVGSLVDSIWDAAGDPVTHIILPDNVDIDEHIEAAQKMLGLKHGVE